MFFIEPKFLTNTLKVIFLRSWFALGRLGLSVRARGPGGQGLRVLCLLGPFFFFFLYSSKILQNILHLHPTILSNYYTNYTNTTGTASQGAKDNDYPVAINIKTRK